MTGRAYSPFCASWIDQAPVGFLATDPAGTVLEANARLLAWTGLTRENLAGASWYGRLLSPASQVLVRTHLVPLLEARGQARGIALELRSASGGRKPVLVDAQAAVDAEGRAFHGLTFMEASDREAWSQDLLAAKRTAEDAVENLRALNLDLERLVLERTRELDRVNQDLNAYVRTVTHDLRNPLQAILALAATLDLAAGPSLQPGHRALLARITQAGEAMSGLVNALLEMALAADKPLRRGRVDLSAIAARLAEELQAAHPDRAVVWDLEPGLEAEADEGLLEIVLRNLLGNAWKYSSGNSSARISFRKEASRDRTAFCVRDDGAGFDAAKAEDLFQPFQRFHGSRAFAGLGIGLATVKRILDRHGGALWVESRPGEGAAFFFVLS